MTNGIYFKYAGEPGRADCVYEPDVRKPDYDRSCLLFLYLAIRHGFEPLLLVPIAFGMLLVNIYPDIMLHAEDSANGTGGLLYYFYVLDEWSILPSLIFLGVGAMTDLDH